MRNYWSLKLSEVVAGLLIFSHTSLAQFSEPDPPAPVKATLNNYVFPIEPGKTAMLTGTMGELRNTHFHGGLDINTVTIGYAVRCANDGYIARATSSTSGYGNCLMITHTDGNTTLYAHLNEFRGTVGEYLRKERYRRKTSEIDLVFAPGQFPVKRGDTIAFSGNTGSSGGPHLHFELRNESNEALNPLILGFDEVVDNIPPILQKIALRTLTMDSRINDQFGRFEFHASKAGSNYSLTAPIIAKGKIGIEIQAYDKQENSRFKCGINRIEVYAKGEKVFVQTIDKINFSDTRNILTLMDFKTLELRGTRFNKLYVDDGNRLPYYGETRFRDGIDVKESEIPVEIRMIDYHGNSSMISLTLKPMMTSNEVMFPDHLTKPFQVEVLENVLIFSAKACADQSSIDVHAKGVKQTVNPSYFSKEKNVYLIDLKNVFPDSIESCQGTWVSNYRDRIPSGTIYKYYSDLAEIEFPEKALYDTMLFNLSYDSSGNSESFTIGQPTIPLHTSIRVSLRPVKEYINTRNLAVYRMERNGPTHLGGIWANGKVNFNTLSFGEFRLLRDSIPPRITAISLNSTSARLRIRDDLAGISYFEASISGQWLLMNYDYKTGILHSERLDKSKLLQGDFELKVVDNAGNESIFKQKIL